MSDSKDLVPAEPVDIERYLSDVSTPDIEAPAEVERQLIQRVLDAPTPAEALKAPRLPGGRDYLNVPLTIRAVSWRKSSYDSAEGVYAVIDAVVKQTGEVVAIGTGARIPMAFLYRAQRESWLPVDVMFTQPSKTTAGGFKPLNLVPA